MDEINAILEIKTEQLAIKWMNDDGGIRISGIIMNEHWTNKHWIVLPVFFLIPTM